MDKIDLDAILMDALSRNRTEADRKRANNEDNYKLWKRLYPDTYQDVIKAMKEAIHQALVLACEKARANGVYSTGEGLAGGGVNKQSILNVEKLII